MPPVKELSGVVSIDLRNEPQFPFDPHAAAAIAVGLQVNSEEDYAVAARMIQESATCIAQVEAFFEEEKSLAFRLHRAICDKVTKFTASWRTVRPTLEPRMKAFRQEQERIRREEEDRQRREAEAARVKAEAEARRIQAAADAKAEELRRAGEMRQAREVVTQATEQAAQVVDTADALADLGTIAPAAPVYAGVGESRPWVGEVLSVREICLAIGTGVIPLEWLTPVRGAGEQMVALVDVNMSVLNHIAKRMGKTDIGIPGAQGSRSVSLRFSKGGIQAGHAAQGEDGW